jgi:hypothetical protein
MVEIVGSENSTVLSARARKCFRELSLGECETISSEGMMVRRYTRCQQRIDIYCSKADQIPETNKWIRTTHICSK